MVLHSNNTVPKVAIIGAGMSGLSAAQTLKDKCIVKLFDKSRGAGGRMSTRYAGDYEFDHGAQYFTVQDASFQAVIDTAMDAGVAAPWVGRAFYLKSDELVQDMGRERYVGAPRMNCLPKFLAQNLDVTLGRRVLRMTRENKSWTLEFETGDVESGFDAVICSAPPEQAQHLLPANFSDMPAVKSAKMQACFALMAGLPPQPDSNLIDLGWDSLRVSGSPIAWMAMNSAKPGRKPEAPSLVIHAAAAWSEQHQDADRAWVQSTLLDAAAHICGKGLSPHLPSNLVESLQNAPHIALHRWLYASVSTSPEQDCLFDSQLNLAACGDWCLGGRVEGAWLSGQAAGHCVLKVLERL